MINLKKRRKELGLTQNQLSELTGIAQNDISRYESGRMNPTVDNLIQLADVLNVTTDYLLERE
jgi:transcriptional regulator with XRE-family HTH domain